jgi:hypothetical protein
MGEACPLLVQLDMRDTKDTSVEEQTASASGSAGLLALELAAGAAAGALTGAIAGPPGAIIGAVLGGAAGVAAGVVRKREARDERQHDEQLDRAIGVSGGHIGEASPDQPPSRHGLFHSDVLGISSPAREDSDGIIQNVDAG